MRCPDSAIFSLSTLANSERSGEPVIRASSATVPLTFGNLVNELLLRRSSRFISLVGKQNTRERPSRLRNQRLDDEPTSTKTAIAPLFIGVTYSLFMHSYPPYLKALPIIADAATYHVAILCNPWQSLASQRLVRSKPHH